LLIATVFTLLFVPCVYGIVYAKRTASKQKPVVLLGDRTVAGTRQRQDAA
jgi:hypothetical protein